MQEKHVFIAFRVKQKKPLAFSPFLMYNILAFLLGKVGLNMDTQPRQDDRPVNPRRRRRTKSQIFRETYLPFLIIAVAVLAVIAVIVAVASGTNDPSNSGGPSLDNQAQMEQAAKKLLSKAETLALSYDYDGALKLLNSFEGDLEDFPKIKEAIESYTIVKKNMVSWKADQVPNLSFHTLIADLKSALADKTYGQSGNNRYNRNFITTTEFSVILQQLYENDYVLVDLSDLYTYEESSKEYVEKEILLPADKKPILLTQTHCNYYNYMAESHAFASKLCYGKDGFYNEMSASSGSTVIGNYDFVPILENFIQKNPGFSYQGARAVLAFSGYDGIFGYRITSEDLTSDALAKEQDDAKALAKALRDAGYTLACYTYNNISYSTHSAQEIQKDIQLWQKNIASIIGQTDILVFAQEADIGTNYKNNEKFDVLYENGYRFFLGSAPFLSCETGSQYVRHSRLIVSGTTLYHNAKWFKDILDTSELLNSTRGTIPQ